MNSVSVIIGPRDKRCRYWAKILRDGQPLLAPSEYDGSRRLPGAYLRACDEELMPGDVLIDGEEQHHRRIRGWLYHIAFINSEGELIWVNPGSSDKADVKSQGLAPDLLSGAGGVAACVRLIHALRAGLTVRGHRLSGEG